MFPRNWIHYGKEQMDITESTMARSRWIIFLDNNANLPAYWGLFVSILSLPGEVVETQVQRKETAPGLTHPMGGQNFEPMGCHSHVVQGPGSAGSGASWISTSTSRRHGGSSFMAAVMACHGMIFLSHCFGLQAMCETLWIPSGELTFCHGKWP